MSNSIAGTLFTLENKINYIDNIINNLGYKEHNYRLISTYDYTPIEIEKGFFGETFDYVIKIKDKWDESKNRNPDDRIKHLFEYLHQEEIIIKKFNIFDNSSLYKAVRYWIEDKDQAIEFYGHISNWDTSCVTEMDSLFSYQDKFNEDISKWDTSNVTNMEHMFEGATSFNQNIGSWDTSNVEFMSSMFRNTKEFNGDISNWNTSKVRLIDRMFEGAESFNQNINTKPIRNNYGKILYTAWDVSNVKYSYNMFKGATSFNGIVSDWTLDPNKFIRGSINSGLNTGLDITLYLKLGINANKSRKKSTKKTKKTKKIIINPFCSVRELHKLLNDYKKPGNYSFLNIFRNNEDFLKRKILRSRRELRSYGIQNNDILTYINTREEN